MNLMQVDHNLFPIMTHPQPDMRTNSFEVRNLMEDHSQVSIHHTQSQEKNNVQDKYCLSLYNNCKNIA